MILNLNTKALKNSAVIYDILGSFIAIYSRRGAAEFKSFIIKNGEWHWDMISKRYDSKSYKWGVYSGDPLLLYILSGEPRSTRALKALLYELMGEDISYT